MPKKPLILTIISSFIFGFASFSFAESKITELAEERRSGEGVIVLCVDGLKVLLTTGYGNGTGSSAIQLYEERNGKVVPVRCSNK